LHGGRVEQVARAQNFIEGELGAFHAAVAWLVFLKCWLMSSTFHRGEPLLFAGGGISPRRRMRSSVRVLTCSRSANCFLVIYSGIRPPLFFFQAGENGLENRAERAQRLRLDVLFKSANRDGPAHVCTGSRLSACSMSSSAIRSSTPSLSSGFS